MGDTLVKKSVVKKSVVKQPAVAGTAIFKNGVLLNGDLLKRILGKTNELKADQQLATGDQLVSKNGVVRLVMQSDGNLVLYRTVDEKALWSSRTYGQPVVRAVMQADGNFVCYDKDGVAYWASGTAGFQGSYVILQDDGNLVIYGPNGGALWATATQGEWDPMTVDTGDVRVGAGEHMEVWASMASTGLISGHTHIWCTKDLAGFHGSSVAMLLDAAGKVIWPPNPQLTKHQFGVDGVWVGCSNRTAYWADQADPSVLPQAKALAVACFLDPKSMLMTDLPIIGKTIAEVAAAIQAVIQVAGAVATAVG